MGQPDEDGSRPWQPPSSVHRAWFPRTSHERSRTGRLRQAEARISMLRDAELNPVRKARSDDLAIQEQGLNFIRNLIGPNGTGSADTVQATAEMIDHLFLELQEDRLFEILASKLDKKTNLFSCSIYKKNENKNKKQEKEALQNDTLAVLKDKSISKLETAELLILKL